jgi:transcriptional regulator with XRE-family HTH domain
MAPATSDDTDLVVISRRLVAARERSGLTLDETASASGMSKAHLSRLESGDRQPSIATLIAVARALDTPVSWLLGEDSDSTSLAIHGPETGTLVNGMLVAPASGFGGSSLLEAVRIVVDTDRAPSSPVSHPGEEWVYVADGVLHLEYDGELVAVEQGHCAHFDAERPHRLSANDGRVEVLLVTVDRPKTLRNLHR